MKKGLGGGAYMAVVTPIGAVPAGFTDADSEPAARSEVVALNVRLPKDLHRTLRQLAFEGETSINAILVQAAEEWLAKRR